MGNNIQYDDFKYVLQDTSHVYLGTELTYRELMEREDVPFKLKAIISSYFAKDTTLDARMLDHILTAGRETFSYLILEQLKVQVRIFYAVEKKGLTGTRKKWIHKTCTPAQLQEQYADAVRSGAARAEEITISKLALMMISI